MAEPFKYFLISSITTDTSKMTYFMAKASIFGTLISIFQVNSILEQRKRELGQESVSMLAR